MKYCKSRHGLLLRRCTSAFASDSEKFGITAASTSAGAVFTFTGVASGKTVAAICHAPWTLIEADVLKGRTLTSWPSLKTDITNAGGSWVDERNVVDGNLITSRNPDDIPAFNSALVDAIEHGSAGDAAE